MKTSNILIDDEDAKLVNTGDLSNTPPKSYKSRAKLQSVSDVSSELAKLYREARNKKIDVSDASRLANMLSILSRILGDTELERRIEALEQRGAK